MDSAPDAVFNPAGIRIEPQYPQGSCAWSSAQVGGAGGFMHGVGYPSAALHFNYFVNLTGQPRDFAFLLAGQPFRIRQLGFNCRRWMMPTWGSLLTIPMMYDSANPLWSLQRKVDFLIFLSFRTRQNASGNSDIRRSIGMR